MILYLYKKGVISVRVMKIREPVNWHVLQDISVKPKDEPDF